MIPPRIKTAAFVLEGMNSVFVTLYFYFIFWFLKSEYGFGSRENLLWAVGNGFVYVIGSIQGGRFGQRKGYLRALRVGFAGLSVCLFLGWLLNRAGLSHPVEIPLQALVMVLATVFVCFTWPNLEALVSEGEPPARIQRLIGIYNLVWSGAGAAAYFAGGALIQAFGAKNIVLLVPAVGIGIQYFMVRRLSQKVGDLIPAAAAGHAHAHAHAHSPTGAASAAVSGPGLHHARPAPRRSPIPPRVFLLMSWIANPCAYVAINAAIPLIPTLAERLGLDTRLAGFFCSIWLFTRTATFLGLWRWNGWHYSFRWLGAAYLGTIVGFLFLFLAAAFPGLDRTYALLVSTAAQIVFGIGIGLIYYSSLFYSMDVGDTKGDHGGIHEAAIGAGILGGPLVGALADYAHPGSATAPAWAVSAVLLVGFGVLSVMRFRSV
jgi:MFS family permease